MVANRTRVVRPPRMTRGGRTERWPMEKAKRARKAETQAWSKNRGLIDKNRITRPTRPDERTPLIAKSAAIKGRG
jgi:hypothetical protein